MDKQTQGNNPDASAMIPVKRKRGRPRKYPRPDHGHGGNAKASEDQNLGHGENACAPSAFGGVNSSQPRQAEPINDEIVGQLVHGVIDAAFDAGYLLTVRVGTLDTTLRGVVFKPGHCVPVSAENDVAPGVQMIRRNDIPVPKENYTYGHSHNNQSRDRNGTAHAARSNPVVSKGKQVPLMTQTSGVSSEKVEPVVLRPVTVNASNGVTTASECSGAVHADHPASSKGKQVVDAAHPSDRSAPTNHVLHVQSQNDHQPSVMPSASGPSNQNPAEAQLEAGAKSMQLPAMRFEKLSTEVVKRIPGSPQPSGTNSDSAGKLSMKDSGLSAEDDVSDTDQPLSIEPLQSIQPALHTYAAVATRPLEDHRTGKMTQLLQVLQENMMENQATQAKELAGDTRPKPDEVKRPERESEDDKSNRSKKHLWASSV